jgi:dTDP-4-dehydrorhamnose reductase
MKILITGINGQIGSALVHQAKEQGHEVVEISRKQWDMAKSPELGKDLVLQSKPDIVINTAAYTNVDDAEDNEATALKVNANAPRSLAKACSYNDIPIIHLSTDYVFDGSKTTSYSESDQTNPLNAYGRTKLAGEIAIQEETAKHLILRTSWVFSKNGTNFVNTILKLASEREKIKVVNDQFGAPTCAECIASVILKLAKLNQIQWGIYHYTGQPVTNWFNFSKEVVKLAKVYNKIKTEPKLIECISNELKQKVKRPKNSILDQKKIQNLLEINPCLWKIKLEKMFQ